jgi:hypothetical protein
VGEKTFGLGSEGDLIAGNPGDTLWWPPRSEILLRCTWLHLFVVRLTLEGIKVIAKSIDKLSNRVLSKKADGE